MINEKSKYSSRNILKIAAIWLMIFFCLNLILGVIGIYYYPQYTENIIKLTFLRTGLIFESCLIVSLLIYHKREKLKEIFPIWLLLPLLGICSLLTTIFGQIMIWHFFMTLNCSSTKFSGCNYLTNTQAVLSVALSFIFSFAVTVIFILLIQFISSLFQKNTFEVI